MRLLDVHYRALMELAPDAIVVADAQGTILEVNAQAERIFGYTASELIGRPVELLVPAGQRDYHAGLRARFAASPATRAMEAGLDLRAQRKDGSEFPVDIGLTTVASGGDRFIAAIVRDVSERRLAEAAMKRLAALVDASSDAIVGKTLDGIVTSWNRGAEQIFGYSAAEIVGQPMRILIPPEFRGEERQMLDAVARRECLALPEAVRLRKDGQRIWVSISAAPIVDADGRIVGASKVLRDITAHRQSEDAARRANAYLRSAVEAISDAFLLLDENERVVLANSTARHMFGKALAFVDVGVDFGALLDAVLANGALDGPDRPDGPHGHDACPETARQAMRARWLAYHRAPTGTLELRTRAGRVLRVSERATAERGSLILIADMTDDVAREDELRRARQAAEAASSAKSEFLASMSHELRTPLNAVLGFAQLLQRDQKTPLNPRQHERMAHVVRGGEHLLRLIDDVLDLARIEAGGVMVSPEAVELGPVLAEVVATLEPMATRAGIRLALAPMPADLPAVWADRGRLAQILMNFGSNAVKYGVQDGHARVRAVPLGESVRIEVSDDGIGIPPAEHDKIFEPFQRAGQETGAIEGTGIGLAITRRLATLMGGQVGFRSTVGGGSDFWVDIPVHRPAPDRAIPRVTAELARPIGTNGGVHLIVYVEDNPPNIAFMRELLADFPNLELVTAPTVDIGLAIIRARKPSLVLMDFNLPGVNGVEATRRLASWPETRDIPVVALTAAALPRDSARAADAGFCYYLTKPIKVDALLQVLDDVLPADR